jgi:hypothetical protein
MEDIILVTGRHLARSWVYATFYESQPGAEVSFGVQVFGNSRVHLEWRDARGGELKLGPDGSVRFSTVGVSNGPLTDLGLDIAPPRIYVKTNAYSSEDSVSFAS